MTLNIFLRSVTFLVLIIVCIVPSVGDTTLRPTVVVNYEVGPVVLMPGDIGTVTISLENMATGEIYVKEDDKTFDMNAYIISATLGGNDNIEILDDGYTNIGLLGPSDTLQLTFNIKARNDASDGVHFLYFELIGGSDMYDLNYKIPIKVDKRSLEVTFPNIPSTVMSEMSIILVDFINMRPNDVSGVIVTPLGDDVIITPSEIFLGTIPAENKSTATFNLNTMESTRGSKNISFSISYYNGDNLHHMEGASTAINVVNQSSLLLTAIEVENIGDKYTIMGDLNNVGTTDAKNIIVSVVESENVKPIQPYTRYFIGTLEPDDFSSFELSARITSTNFSDIPISIEFRNSNNAYIYITESIDLEDDTQYTTSQDLGNNSNIIVVATAATTFVGFGIFGIIRYSWKKRKDDI